MSDRRPRHRRIPPLAPMLAMALLAPTAAAPAAQVDRVVTLEGYVVEGPVSAVHADEGIVVGGKHLDFEGVRSIVPARPPLESPESTAGAARMMLVCGTMLAARDVVLADETFTADVPPIGELTFPIDVVRAVRYGPRIADSRYRKGLRELDDSRVTDTFFFRQKGEMLEADGLIQHIGDGIVAYDRERADAEPTLERAPVGDIYGFVLASPLEIEAERRPYRVIVEGGTQLHADWVALDGSVLRVRVIGGQVLDVPWMNVRGIVVHSERLEFLSDLAPVAAEVRTLVAPPREWRRDASVTGAPMVVAGQEFAKGLGVPAGTSLKFAVDGYDVFVSTIGLDASGRGLGDCEFVVRVDGEDRLRRRVRGGDPAAVIRVALGGATTLELAVEAGENLDLADHADWGDACLVKAAE